MEMLMSLLKRGGPVMIPILALSIVAFFVFFERLWRLRRQNILPEAFLNLIKKKLTEGRFEDARILCEGDHSAISAVVAAGLKSKNRTRAEIKTAFEEIGRFEVSALGRFIEVVGTIATVSPLLGLLGTVTGMIDVFRSVVSEAGAGPVNPVSLADGIWAALLTTAAGLCAAIPAFLAYKYLLSRLDGLALEMEETAVELLDLMVPPEQTLPPREVRKESRPAEALPQEG